MSSGTSIFLDTSIQIARMVHSPTALHANIWYKTLDCPS